MSREDRLRAEGFRPYVKGAVMWLKQMNETFTVPSSRGDLVGQPGDYLVTDGHGRSWPLVRAVFAASHEPTKPDPRNERPDLRAAGYSPVRKVAPVWARRLEAPMLVETLEGQRQAATGDWLAVGVKDERWPIPDDFFRANYTPLE